jgi:hypothetical protein
MPLPLDRRSFLAAAGAAVAATTAARAAQVPPAVGGTIGLGFE